MWILVLILSVLATDVFGQGPAYKPTGGEAWPKPRHEKKGDIVIIIDSPKMNYKFIGPGGGDDIEIEAIIRFENNIKILIDIARRFRGHDKYPPSPNTLMELHINLTDPTHEKHRFPHFNMDESYRINVSAGKGWARFAIAASTVWGIVQGLETFSQLFYLSEDYKHVMINTTDIYDYPNYKHRGLLLDTSRHYIEYPYILKTLDAMSMNKLNVLHWHIVDDQSFPYQSKLFPELSTKGAYWPSLVYSRPVMMKIREHARFLGIRVVVEIDMPDHARSWSVSHPEILTQCNGRLGPMNPIKEETYALLGPLLGEVQELFPDAYIHLGGDEVDTQCWLDNKEIQEYMEKHNMSSARDLSALFYNRTAALLKNNTVTIVWEESYHADVPLPCNTLVQVWKDTDNAVDILNKGRLVIQSAPFYLDKMKTTFSQYYVEEPRLDAADDVDNATLLDNIVGGEACMWGEMVDSSNVISRVWPRASAVAEVLWSETHGRISPHVLARAEEHACRMKRRGIHAEPPSGPGFCVL